MEIPVAPELRSTHRVVQPADITKDMCEAVLINRLVERCKQKGKESTEVCEAKVKAAEHKKVISTTVKRKRRKSNISVVRRCRQDAGDREGTGKKGETKYQ